jgi:hypothetical protein
LIIPERDRTKFEELDEKRRRIDEEWNTLIQSMRDGGVSSLENLRIDAQHLHVRHQHLIWDMMDMLVYGS